MSEQPSRRDLGIVAVACVLLRLPSLWSARWFDPDEAAIAIQARAVARGARLYVEIADRKPPIPPLVYAAWFDLTGSTDARGPRLVASLLLAVAAVVLVREVARTHGIAVARWAGALYVVGCFAFTPADGAAANFAQFAIPFATLAILACRRSATSLWWSLGGGLLLGIAILGRQSWVFAVPAAALSCWLHARHRWRATVAYGVGLVLGVGSAALMAPWHDYWFWNFRSSPGFVFASFDLGRAALSGVAAVALFGAYHLALVGGAARVLSGSLRTLRARPGAWRSPAVWRTVDLDLWVWVATGIVASAAGFRFFGHYWLQLVPAMVLLAAPVVATAAPTWRRVAAVTLALTAAIVVVSDTVPTLYRERPDPTAIAAVVRSCTVPADRVFVWGSFPELAMAIDRPIAGGLVHSDFVTGRSGGRQSATDAVTPGAEARMLHDLADRPPAVLVDTSQVTGLGYRAFPLDGRPALAAFAANGYTPTADGEYTLWYRNDTACAATAAQNTPD